MPVNIYCIPDNGQKHEPIAWLCDDIWTLPPQSEALSEWLRENASKYPLGRYVADIGFAGRRDLKAGASAFDPQTLRRMADMGMSLFFSLYPGFADDLNSTVDRLASQDDPAR